MRRRMIHSPNISGISPEWKPNPVQWKQEVGSSAYYRSATQLAVVNAETCSQYLSQMYSYIVWFLNYINNIYTLYLYIIPNKIANMKSFTILTLYARNLFAIYIYRLLDARMRNLPIHHLKVYYDRWRKHWFPGSFNRTIFS